MVLVEISPIAMRVCLIRKRILLTRSTIKSLGNPTHLGFWYNETNGFLTFSPAAKDDMDAFEIPLHYWKSKKQSCEISRMAFLKALQYRIGWEEGSKYSYNGSLDNSATIPTAVFNLVEGTRVK